MPIERFNEIDAAFYRLEAAFDGLVDAAKTAKGEPYTAAVAEFDRAQRSAGELMSTIFNERQ